MDKLRSFWSERQGLNRCAATLSPREALSQFGWQRSIGGTNPYHSIWVRTGLGSTALDRAAVGCEIHELPSARGCTYYLPRDHFSIGLRVAEGTSERAALMTAKKYLGFTDDDLALLCKRTLAALTDQPQDPKALRERLGSAVVNFGEEGKKRGQTTSLSLALGQLQVEGRIRRVPTNGRLDNERYGYVLWNPGPLDGESLDRDEAFSRLARAYWSWLGVARASEFQWFSGLGVKASQTIVASLDLQPVESGSDFLATSEGLAEFQAFEPPRDSRPVFVHALDSMILLRRNVQSLIDPKHLDAVIAGAKGKVLIQGLSDIDNHAILDRGQWIGIWEYDAEKQEVVWHTFDKPTDAVREAAEATQRFIREDVGDARSFSLDSVKSRAPKIELIRQLAKA